MQCGPERKSLALQFCILTTIYQQVYHMSQQLSFLAACVAPKDSQKMQSSDFKLCLVMHWTLN